MMRKHLGAIEAVKRELDEKGIGRLMFLCLSGSHSYGWATKDSDFDYRGIFIADTNKLIGLDRPKDRVEMETGDIVLFELGKAMGLALKGNSNVLEWFESEVAYSTPEFLDLQKLVRDNTTKQVYNAYKGMATFNYKKFIKQGRRDVKKYLYIIRGLLAGMYVLKTGKIEPNITKLHSFFGRPFGVPLLLNHKQQNTELDEVEKEVIEETIDEYFKQLDQAYQESELPEYPDRTAFNKYLLKVRRSGL